MGIEERAPTREEQTEMRRELEAAMRAGAWGFTSGLEYPPSAYANEDELADLCRVVADWGGFYATHLRNEGDTLMEAVQEALNVAEQAGLPLQLSHHKAEGRENWGKVQTTLQMVRDASKRGVDVQMDQYPYPAFMTALSIQTLPRYALNGSGEDLTARLTDPVQRGADCRRYANRAPGLGRSWPGLALASSANRRVPRPARSAGPAHLPIWRGKRTEIPLTTFSICWRKPAASSARSILPSVKTILPTCCAFPSP